MILKCRAVGAVRGLVYLESKKVLHRDIGLRNLLASTRDCGHWTSKVCILVAIVLSLLKIGDFVLSRISESGKIQLTEASTFPVKWSAPEGNISVMHL